MRILLILLVLAGAGMWFATRDAPRHIAAWQTNNPGFKPVEDSDEASRIFFEAEARHRTRTSHVNDAGTGVTALGLSLLLLAVFTGTRRWSDLLHLRTPRHRTTIWISVLGSWVLAMKAEMRWLEYTARRGDLPWWADTIAIGFMEYLVGGTIIAIMLVVLLAVSLAGVRGPMSVQHLDTRRLRFWPSTLVASGLACGLLQSIWVNVINGAGLLVVATLGMLASLTMWWIASASTRPLITPPPTPPALSSPASPTAQ